MEEELRRLIANGLEQPVREPEFFTYPAGYDLAPSQTLYSLSQSEVVNSNVSERNAQLEPST